MTTKLHKKHYPVQIYDIEMLKSSRLIVGDLFSSSTFQLPLAKSALFYCDFQLDSRDNWLVRLWHEDYKPWYFGREQVFALEGKTVQVDSSMFSLCQHLYTDNLEALTNEKDEGVGSVVWLDNTSTHLRDGRIRGGRGASFHLPSDCEVITSHVRQQLYLFYPRHQEWKDTLRLSQLE